MRAILLGLLLVGAFFVVAPVADACVPPNCPGFGQCHIRETPVQTSDGETIWVPTGLDCYY